MDEAVLDINVKPINMYNTPRLYMLVGFYKQIFNEILTPQLK